MKVFSLSRKKHATPLSGKGAAKYGARWNPGDIALIYTAQNRSLAMAEVAVHLTLATLPEDYMVITIDIPEDIKVKQLTEADLPEDWQAFPNPYPSVQVHIL
jgi:RES domain-containing protein